MMVYPLRARTEFLLMLWGVLVILNEFASIVLECKGAAQSPEERGL